MALDRRTFLSLIGGCASGVLATVGLRPRKYGHLTVDRARALGFLPCRVLLDGRDVSKDCIEADDVNGHIVRFWEDASGGKHVDSAAGGLRRETLYGRVEVFPNWKFK